MTDKSKAKRAAIGACIALFANMGMNSVFTVFLPVFQTEWGADQIANIALAATFGCLMASACSMFLVGPLLKKLAPRSLFLICAVLAAIYCLLYFSATKVWMLIVAGLFGGLVLAIGTHAMGVAVITPYFGKYGSKAPLVISLVLASAALGAAAFSFLPGLLFARMSWRNIFLVIGAIVVVCDVIAFLLIPKAEKTAAADTPAAAAPEAEGLTMGQTLKTPAFWLVFLGVLFLTIMYQGLCVYMPSYLTALGMSESVGASMQGVMQTVGIVFIFAGGALVNKIGVKGLILFAGVPLTAGVLLFAYLFPSVMSVALAVVCSVLCVTGAVITNICPTITPVLFGQKSMNQINSIYSGGAFWGGAALASQVVGRVITGTGSFANGFLTAAVIGVAGMALLFVSLAVSPMKKRAE